MKHLFYAMGWGFLTGYCFYGFVEYADPHMIFVSGAGTAAGVMLAGWEVKKYYKQRR